MQLLTIDLTDTSRWDSIILEFPEASAYHLSGYHKSDPSEGSALLFAFYEDNTKNRPIAAIPLIKRNIPNTKHIDLTSVYGYPGWLFQPSMTKENKTDIRNTFAQFCKKEMVVSVFSRLNPFGEYDTLFNMEMGEIHPINSTIWINTQHYPQEQSLQLKRSLRRAVSKGIRIEQQTIEGLSQFLPLYLQTMQSKGAKSSYLFPCEYFEQLFSCKEISPIFFTAFLEQEAIGSALFFHYGQTAYYHLGGASAQHTKLSPLKSLLDHSVGYYLNIGVQRIQLGGGYNGSENDGLTFFKRQFSKQQATFSTWHWITNPEAYAQLSKDKATSNFFPLYRSI